MEGAAPVLVSGRHQHPSAPMPASAGSRDEGGRGYGQGHDHQSGGGAYPYEYVLEYYAAFQNNTLRWYAKYTQKSGNNQPVEMDSAAYQLNAAGTNYGWLAFG